MRLSMMVTTLLLVTGCTGTEGPPDATVTETQVVARPGALALGETAKRSYNIWSVLEVRDPYPGEEGLNENTKVVVARVKQCLTKGGLVDQASESNWSVQTSTGRVYRSAPYRIPGLRFDSSILREGDCALGWANFEVPIDEGVVTVMATPSASKKPVASWAVP